MSTEINKTPTESEHCTCNKTCPIHTEVESSIKDKSKYLLNDERDDIRIIEGMTVIIFVLICSLYVIIFGSDDIIYIKDIIFYEEDLRPRLPFLTTIVLGISAIIYIIETIVYIFVKKMRVRDKFSFDLIYTLF